jgi:hypothetical protein
MTANPEHSGFDEGQSTEKRRKSRRTFDIPLNVFDAESGRLVGQVTNMTSSGMLLFSAHPVRLRHTAHVFVELPTPMDGRDVIDVRIQCRWCHRIAGRRDFESGFRFVKMSFRQKLLLETFLAGKKLEAAVVDADAD